MPTAFVLMPFDQGFTQIYREVLGPAQRELSKGVLPKSGDGVRLHTPDNAEDRVLIGTYPEGAEADSGSSVSEDSRVWQVLMGDG